MRSEFVEVHLANGNTDYACVYTIRKNKRRRLPTIAELGAYDLRQQMANPNLSAIERSNAEDNLQRRGAYAPSLQDEASFAAITFDGTQMNAHSDRNKDLTNPVYGAVDGKWNILILKVEWVDVPAIEQFVRVTPLPAQVKHVKVGGYAPYNCYAHVARLLQVGAEARHPDTARVPAGVWFNWDRAAFMSYLGKLERVYSLEEAQEKFQDGN